MGTYIEKHWELITGLYIIRRMRDKDNEYFDNCSN